MIQDIVPALNNAYDPSVTPSVEDAVFSFEGEALLLHGESHALPLARQLSPGLPLTYAFSIGERRFFLALTAVETPAGFTRVGFRELRTLLQEDRPLLFAVFTAKHLVEWYRDTARCGRCGEKTVHSSRERAMICPACGHTFYPRIQPAVIVGVIKGDQLLLTRYNRGYAHNALVAGFTEIGETLEQTVSREVMEEAGIPVRDIRYYKSQPWGSAGDILAGFYCDADGDVPLKVDRNELKSAVWTRRDQIELQPDDLSLTNEMMKRFKEGKPC